VLRPYSSHKFNFFQNLAVQLFSGDFSRRFDKVDFFDSYERFVTGVISLENGTKLALSENVSIFVPCVISDFLHFDIIGVTFIVFSTFEAVPLS
jgi:hypothetical protein